MYKRLIQGKKAILFDLDGTVADTEYLWIQSFRDIYKKTGGLELMAEVIITEEGTPVLDKWKEILAKNLVQSPLSPEQLTNEVKELFIEYLKVEPVASMAGFWEFARVLKIDKELKLGLTTNTDKDIANLIMKKIGITEVFDLIIYGDDVKHKKPNPEIYKTALRQLKLRPAEVLVFEDSLAGTEAATAAGIPVVVIWNGSIPRDNYPSKVLAFFADFDGLAYNIDNTFNEALKDWEERLKKVRAKKESVNQQTESEPRSTPEKRSDS